MWGRAGTFAAHRAALAAAALAFFTLCEDISRLHSGRRYAQNASATTGATLIRDLWRMRLSRHCTQRAHDCGRPLRGRVIFLPAKPRLRIPGPNPNPNCTLTLNLRCRRAGAVERPSNHRFGGWRQWLVQRTELQCGAPRRRHWCRVSPRHRDCRAEG